MSSWFDKLKREGKDILKKGKDRAVSSPIASFLLNRTRISRYGKLLHLELDSFHQKANFSLLLLGEEAPIEVALSYETNINGSEHGLIITAASVSREWMDILMQHYVINQSLPIPKELYTLLN